VSQFKAVSTTCEIRYSHCTERHEKENDFISPLAQLGSEPQKPGELLPIRKKAACAEAAFYTTKDNLFGGSAGSWRGSGVSAGALLAFLGFLGPMVMMLLGGGCGGFASVSACSRSL
jgi:hypothetical protein